MSKLKLYIDFDCTITNTIGAIVSLYNEDFQYYSDFVEVNPDDVCTWGFEECNCATSEYINTYFNQPRFFKRLNFIDEYTYKAIKDLTYYYDICVVSHGYSPNLRAKEEWVEKHLPFVDFLGVNLKYHPDKSCVDMSDGVFIDDGSNNLKTSNAAYKICFGKEYPWNKDWNGLRVFDWWKLYNHLVTYAIRKGEEINE